MINQILDRISPLWGVCNYSSLENRIIDCRAKSRIPENASSVIVAAFPYLLDEEAYEGLNISKYAVVPDYHEFTGELLKKACAELKNYFPEYSFEFFADNSPIPEVYAACISGLGVIGKNQLLLTDKYGSFVFIGEIVTNMHIKCEERAVSRCMNCGACSDACPGKAISNEGITIENCLSHITQKKGDLTEKERELIKKSGCIWGCDICQNVCPYNANASTTIYKYLIDNANPTLSECTSIEGRAFAWRGKNVINRNLDIIGENT